MSNEITGTIELIKATQVVSDKFKKREFVINDGATSYPQSILFEVTQDKVDLLDNVKVGDSVQVRYNLRGRKWTNAQGEDKYFNTLQAWAVVKAGEKPISTPTPNDDLPF